MDQKDKLSEKDGKIFHFVPFIIKILRLRKKKKTLAKNRQRKIHQIKDSPLFVIVVEKTTLFDRSCKVCRREREAALRPIRVPRNSSHVRPWNGKFKQR